MYVAVASTSTSNSFLTIVCERERERAFERKAKQISTHGREPNDILT